MTEPPPPPEYPHAKALGTVLHNLRRHREMKLIDVSKRAAISVAYLSQIELARNAPTVHVLARIAGVFELPLSELFSMAESYAEMNPTGEDDVRSER